MRVKRHRCEDKSADISRALCTFVDCFTDVDRKSKCERRAENTVVLFQNVIHPPSVSADTLIEFFPDVQILNKFVSMDTPANELVAYMDTVTATLNVRKFILNVSTEIIQQFFLSLAKKYRKATFIAVSSIDPAVRLPGVRPRNLFFSLQAQNVFIPQTFNLRADSSGSNYIIIQPDGNAYQEYVSSVAQAFGITPITPAQVSSFQSELLSAQVIYFSLFFQAQQELAVSSLPAAFTGSIVFISMPPATQQIADALPDNAFNTLLYSPGSGTVVSQHSKWSKANRPSTLSYPVTSTMSIYYYLSFLEDWDTFIERDIVLDTSNANYRLVINPIRKSPPT